MSEGSIELHEMTGSSGILYFVGPLDQRMIKIGYARRDGLWSRISGLQTGNWESLRIHAFIPFVDTRAAKRAETQLHRKYEASWHRSEDGSTQGEWFRYTRELGEEIDTYRERFGRAPVSRSQWADPTAAEITDRNNALSTLVD